MGCQPQADWVYLKMEKHNKICGLSAYHHFPKYFCHHFPIIFAIFGHTQKVPIPPAASNSAANRNHDYGGWMYSAAWDQQMLGAPNISSQSEKKARHW
jgi:hypothetical protein